MQLICTPTTCNPGLLRLTDNLNYELINSIMMKTILKSFFVLLAMLMSQVAWADIVTTTYDFTTQNDDKTVTYSTTNERNCTYFTKIGKVSDPGRFGAQNPEKWVFQRTDGNGITSNTIGLCNNYGSGRRFLVSNLYAGDVVTFDVVGLNGSQTDVTTASESSGATKSNNSFTMSEKGSLVVWIANLSSIKTITIQHDNSGVYEYDPAVEIYDLSGITGGAVTATESAGYKFSSAYSTDALILGNPSGYSLNNRIVVQNGNFQWANGLQNTGSGYRLVGINNLLEGDRVVITFTGTNTFFSSRHESDKLNQVFAAAGKVFKDGNNDGELNDGETMITAPGTPVESQAVYTMTADGHLDIALERSQKITKIEIYSDHEAQMLDRFDASTGYTAYFSKTGQLLDKEHNLGGLEIHVGNEDNTQHAIVVSSDEGPVSFVYDQGHYKMARQSDNSTNITNAPPASGTFYKFMPEVDGYMTVNFKAYNVKYNDYDNGNGKSSGNEVPVTSGTCPYYIMVKDANNTFSRYIHPNGNTEWGHEHYNGHNGKFENIKVTAGNTYYVYGWWSKDSEGRQAGSEGFNFRSSSCGVAELIDVTFMPDNMVYPLAKYVASGTTADNELAHVSTTTTNSDLHIKKKSANISSCEPYVEGGVLKIRNIQFVSGQNPGGTILIKVGSPSDDAAPVFAYTIAYDANWQPTDWDDASRSKGHSWDFSTNPLRGLKWNNTSGEAVDVDFGKGAGPGLLYDEMHETLGGTAHSDWTFKYVTEKGDTKRDPMYLNKYPMKGDNADMMWDTEGLIFNTAANQSCINNEFDGVVNHASDLSGGTATDPDRFVGVRNGGSFTIPLLEAGDRVIIYMGSADAHTSSFNITGALDAIGKTIESTDEYRAGGSLWSTMGGKCQYRGAYQFISTGGDMTFTLANGELVKLYSIQIYRGAKSGSTDCSKTDWNTTYNGVEYIPAYQVNNDWRTGTPAASYIQLHYRGKGERLRAPTVLYKSGSINTNPDHLFYAEIGSNNAPYIFFKSEKGQYGMFRMRVDDMESNGKFVADYALQNMTVGYLEKKNYPYTWDFTDLQGYAYTANRIQDERTKVGNYNPKTVDDDKLYDMEFMNNSTGEGVKTVEQWKYYEADGDIPAGYGLQVRNEPYSGGLMWDSNQLYAGEEFFEETLGLRFIAPGQNQNYNGGLRITEEGISLTGGNWKIMIPAVADDEGVYIRAKQVGTGEIIAGVGNEGTAFTYVGTATDGTGEKIYAVKGTGEDMTLVFNNLIIKKIAVSSYKKTLNDKGWATESRNDVIDPALTAYMTGKDMRTYIATTVDFPNKNVTLLRIDKDSQKPEFKGYLMDKTTAGGDDNACIIRNVAAEGETPKLSILEGGFHLFVPDMHDYIEGNTTDSKKMKWNDGTNLNNELVSVLNQGTIDPKTGEMTNYAFTCKYVDIDPETGKVLNQTVKTGDQAFYRIAQGGATSKGNQAYLPILVPKPATSRALEASAASAESTATPLNFSITLANRSDVMTNLGDVNADGTFNQTDVESMTKYVTGRQATLFFKGLADINGDGVVDIVDLTRLIRKMSNE